MTCHPLVAGADPGFRCDSDVARRALREPGAVARDLEEAEDRVAVDAKADHAGARVDLRDRVRGDEPAAAGEEARANRDRVRNIGSAAVHRSLDSADDSALRVGDAEADRSQELGA